MEKGPKIIEILSLLNKLVYIIIMPLIVAILLLIVSQSITRPLFFDSFIVDLVVRIWLCICFCLGYIILANIKKYESWFYQRKYEDLKSKNNLPTTLWNISRGIMFGLFSGLVSWWTVQVFLPNFIPICWFIAILHGLVFSLPIVIQSKSINF